MASITTQICARVSF